MEGTEELSKGLQLFVNMQLHENTTWICTAEDFWRLEEQNLSSFYNFSSPDLCNGDAKLLSLFGVLRLE